MTATPDWRVGERRGGTHATWPVYRPYPNGNIAFFHSRDDAARAVEAVNAHESLQARIHDLEEALRRIETCGIPSLVAIARQALAPPSQEKPDYRPPVSPSDPENYSRHRPSQGSAQEDE